MNLEDTLQRVELAGTQTSLFSFRSNRTATGTAAIAGCRWVPQLPYTMVKT